MSAVVIRGSTPSQAMARLEKRLRSDAKKLETSIRVAAKVTSRRAVPVIRDHTPKAFGELADSVIATERNGVPVTAVTAPYASAVERGTLPGYLPPVEELAKWIRLQGARGLTSTGRIRRGARNALPARIATMLKQLETRGRGRHAPIDAPMKAAWALAKSLEKRGTRPRWYVRSSLPEIMVVLKEEVDRRLGDK